MEQVSSDARALRLPVKPYTACAVMYVVMAVHNVYCGVHLNSADLRSCKVLLVVYVVNVIIFNKRENATQVTDNTGLSAVMNMAPPYDVRADVLFCPAFPLCQTNTVALRLRAILVFRLEPLVVVLRLQILAERNTGALRLVNLAVLDYPAL